MTKQIFVFLCLFTSLISSEIVQHYPCDSEIPITSKAQPANGQPESWRCDIQQVRVTPCPIADKDKTLRCNIKRGSVMKIDFDFITAENQSTVETTVQRIGSNRGYFRNHHWFNFAPNQVENYSFNVTVDKSTLPRPYDIKWRLENEQKQNCCFIIKISVRK
ncbi:uncharacterized protein LOC134831118 [Culicoides brevitarsis]|uniref:uncharacterized protein LOC134831118 n=1 Tax=Culicoides brevitarsis TaxID=469753 RepID=UPI00307C94B0